jgi:signal transduction histidine kinase
MNKTATRMLSDSGSLKNYLFGKSNIDDELRSYSPEKLLYNVSRVQTDNGDTIEVFGKRVEIGADGRRFELQLGPQVILLRDITDQFLVGKEIGKLYRHELGAALDIMGIGLQTAKQLISQNKPEDAVNFINHVESKRMQLVSMLEERIDFIRLHSDSFRITPSTLNLNVLIEKCVSSYRQVATERMLNLSSNHLKTGAVYVKAEERFLIKLFDNLLRNAIKFSKESGFIKVTLGSRRNEAFVKLEDNGAGIPEKNLNRIFKLGFTTGGTGRGLYLARKIAMAHSGRIEVKSKEGHGACFTVFLPLCREDQT